MVIICDLYLILKSIKYTHKELNMNYIKPNDSSRKGDLAEYYAVTWLWDNGYEVFRNTGCTGPIDMIAMKDGETIFVDVKT